MCQSCNHDLPPLDDDLVKDVLAALSHGSATTVTEDMVRANPQEYLAYYCEDDESNTRPHWNFRLVTRHNPYRDVEEYTLMRVEYEDGELSGFDNSPITLATADLENMVKLVARMNAASSKSVLQWQDLLEAAKRSMAKHGPTCDHDECWESVGKKRPERKENAWT